MSGWELQFRDPRRAWLVRLGVGALLLAVPLAFLGGRWSTGADAARSEADAQRQETLIGEQKAELERLRTEIEVLRSGERLSQQATEQSRQTIKLLEDQVFKQQQDIAFYKGVVAPASKADALEIRAFEVQGTDDPQRFRYKVMLSRLGRDDRKLDGRLKVRISGKLAPGTLPTTSNSSRRNWARQGCRFPPAFPVDPRRGRFAELELPKNFIPKLIDVRAELNGQSKPLQRRFDWPKQ